MHDESIYWRKEIDFFPNSLQSMLPIVPSNTNFSYDIIFLLYKQLI